MISLAKGLSRRLAQLAFLALSVAIVCCNSVKADDLAGSWTMTEASRQYLPAEIRSVVPRLTLNVDGTFMAVDFPGQRRVASTWIAVARSARGTGPFSAWAAATEYSSISKTKDTGMSSSFRTGQLTGRARQSSSISSMVIQTRRDASCSRVNRHAYRSSSNHP